MKKIVFYHADADGVLSALLYSMLNECMAVYLPINYDFKALEGIEVDCETKLVFLDFNLASMDDERLKNLVWQAHRVFVYDHHAGSEERTIAKIESNDLLCKYSHFHYDHAICQAMFNRFTVDFTNAELEHFVKAIAKRDAGGAWDESISFLEREMMKQIHHAFFNCDLYKEMTRERTIDDAISYQQMKKFGEQLLSTNFELLHKEHLKSYADMLQVIIDHDFKFLKLASDPTYIVYVDASEEDIDISELGTYLSKKYKVPCIIKTKYNNKYSVRSCDACLYYASDIAKHFGGGGHKHAAGFSAESIESITYEV